MGRGFRKIDASKKFTIKYKNSKILFKHFGNHQRIYKNADLILSAFKKISILWHNPFKAPADFLTGFCKVYVTIGELWFYLFVI
jgi:hypothetical protein